MPIHIQRLSAAVSASTTSASTTIPTNTKFVRIVNPTTALCYVTSGKGSATATATCPAVGVYSTEIFEIPEDHDTIAVLLSASTGLIPVSTCGAP